MTSETRPQTVGQASRLPVAKGHLRHMLRSRRTLVFAGFALFFAALIFQNRFRLAIVIGDSMLPNLKSGDLLLIEKRAYKRAEPERGDIVVAESTAGLVVKRIVGLPGEEVEVRRGDLYINDTPTPETYRRLPGWLNVEKGKLLSGDFASLGDNRAVPAVLAIHPILSKPDILGKVIFSFGFRGGGHVRYVSETPTS